MSDEDFARLEIALRDPQVSPERVPELVALIQRTGRRPGWVEPGQLLPLLVAYWRENPEDRAPEGLYLGLLGLELDAEPGLRLPIWSGRTGGGGAVDFDLFTGLPLRVRRSRDAAPMVLVPGGPGLHGVGEARPVEIELSPFYLDERPRPGIFSWAAAAARARDLGGRLPTELEAERALRGPRPLPPELAVPPAAGRWISPYGLVDEFPSTEFWCHDWFVPDAYQRHSGRDPRQDQPRPEDVEVAAQREKIRVDMDWIDHSLCRDSCTDDQYRHYKAMRRREEAKLARLDAAGGFLHRVVRAQAHVEAPGGPGPSAGLRFHRDPREPHGIPMRVAVAADRPGHELPPSQPAPGSASG